MLNSTAEQTVEVWLGSDTAPSYRLTAQGNENSNRGTAVLTSDNTGQVTVKVSARGNACQLNTQAIAAQQSQYVGVVAAYNGTDNDGVYNDAYVILNWGQSS
nr:fucose-binding lectin II [Paraburkholderia sp. NMBU_R16]